MLTIRNRDSFPFTLKIGGRIVGKYRETTAFTYCQSPALILCVKSASVTSRLQIIEG